MAIADFTPNFQPDPETLWYAYLTIPCDQDADPTISTNVCVTPLPLPHSEALQAAEIELEKNQAAIGIYMKRSSGVFCVEAKQSIQLKNGSVIREGDTVMIERGVRPKDGHLVLVDGERLEWWNGRESVDGVAINFYAPVI